MTDMHREAFEREFGVPAEYRQGDRYDYVGDQSKWEGWQAALRYRDEQEKQA